MNKILDIKTCTKYFEFLKNQCDEYLTDETVSKDELLRMQNELRRIKSLVYNSELSPDLKNKIEKIDLNYKVSRKSKFIKSLNMIIFRRLESTYHLKKMKESIIDFRSQVLEISLNLKTN